MQSFQSSKEEAKCVEDEWVPDETRVRIVCAAIQHPDTLVIVAGPRHFDHVMHALIRAIVRGGDYDRWKQAKQGFVDQWGRFHDRKAAWLIAEYQGQICTEHDPRQELYSEDLY